jgi:capsular exopolysaccharide synthesis family protein
MFRVKRGKALKNKSSHLVCEDFVRLLHSSPEMAQSYETLLSSLELLNSTRPLKAILITSAQPEEGKTTVSINLALTMMLAGKKTLILDADFRRPKLHQILKVENTQGFVDILTGSRDVQDLIQVVKITDHLPENKQTLDAIASGKVATNSFKLMGSPRLKEAIEYLRNQYDVVLIDSSPVLSVNDPLFLAPMVDGVILVLNTGVVTEKDAKHAKERLEQARGHILGVVMNHFIEGVHGPGYHPYQGYYLNENR